MIKLYENGSECCGCSACVNICPNGAISLAPDEHGFLYPQIDNGRCIECKACKRVCGFQNKEENGSPLAAYAAQVKSLEEIKESTSGGLFAALARKIISNGGAVFGAALMKEGDGFAARHIMAENEAELLPLLKSKYLQSNAALAFQQCKAELESGRSVLFSGTPCQIAGLKAYLKKDYEKLVTADIVCHGVPSNKTFNEYIKWLEKHTGARVKDFQFRSKQHGWELHNMAELEYDDGRTQQLVFDDNDVKYCYMHHFLNLSLFRDSCYHCKYAGKGRPADITLGDYWGIQRNHGDWLLQNGGELNEKLGISCVIINTKKGAELFESIKGRITLYECDFDDVAAGNTQLREPSRKPENSEEILESIKQKGFDLIAKKYQMQINFIHFKLKIKKFVPKSFWRLLKSAKEKLKQR